MPSRKRPVDIPFSPRALPPRALGTVPDPAPGAPRVEESAAEFSISNPVRRVLPSIGCTPLLEICLRHRGRRRWIFAKYESLNFTGSIKDRMAAWILAEAWERGQWRPGMEIVEASSGNTAIAFAALGRALESRVRIFMPVWMSSERVQILGAFGAQLERVSAEQGGFQGSIERAARHAQGRADVFLPRQFENLANVEAHARTTGPEILAQLAVLGLRPDIFVAGVGTGGTVMGVGRALRESCARVLVHPLEPAESPVLSSGRKLGHHRIQGISDEFIPAIVDLQKLDAPVAIHDGDAILAAQKLASEIGLGVGISAGANLLGALARLEQAGGDAVAVTVLPDSHKKYLSTDLFRPQIPAPDWLAPQVEFESWRAIACARA